MIEAEIRYVDGESIFNLTDRNGKTILCGDVYEDVLFIGAEFIDGEANAADIVTISRENDNAVLEIFNPTNCQKSGVTVTVNINTGGVRVVAGDIVIYSHEIVGETETLEMIP